MAPYAAELCRTLAAVAAAGCHDALSLVQEARAWAPLQLATGSPQGRGGCSWQLARRKEGAAAAGNWLAARKGRLQLLVERCSLELSSTNDRTRHDSL